MFDLTTVEIKMEEQAKLGLFCLNEKIGLHKANLLRDKGFDVTDSREVNYFPRLHTISWANATIEGENINLLNETSDKLTFAQKLFVISTKSKTESTKVL